ncbi:uncharacterized protein IUM83_05687 [Phytophthora cinnamomi]|uniref:uncharacterized protein n=1 Tax=Phytophthora cinnamomi TaxID=4785 RepID=UPI003559BCCC|nr:hypothetical protein IUM83_05687 [Phytophthora cinnamomi]
MASGYTAFDSPPAPTYRFVLSSKAETIRIWLENSQSKKQWSTGYLDEKEYVTITNRIPGASVPNYASLFKDTLQYLMDEDNLNNVADGVDKTKIQRTLIELEGDELKLELLVEVRALASAWLAKYVFLLNPVSLDRVDIVEAKLRDAKEHLTMTETKLRDVEKQLARTVTKLRDMEENLAMCAKCLRYQDVVHLRACSNNVEKLNDNGLVIWNDKKYENFELTSERDGIIIVVPGWYILNLKVHLRPQSNWGTVDVRKNNDEIDSSQVPFAADSYASASLGCSIRFDKADKLDVILTKSPHRVGAILTLIKIAD